MKIAKGTYDAKTSPIPEEVVPKVASNLASEAFVEKEQAALDAKETDITRNILNYIFEDLFDSSTLNHISPTPSPKQSLKHTPSPTHNIVQLSEHVMYSPIHTPVLQILDNSLNLVDSKHPTGETTGDRRQLGYISDSE